MAQTRVRTRIRAAVEGLTPGYFALVMATGIVSVGMELRGFSRVSLVLLWGCSGAYALLLVLTSARFLLYRHAVREDFLDPRRAFGFFTLVAGTNVLGVRLGLAGHHDWTLVLLVASGLVWVVLGYVIPWTAVLGREERPVVQSANGTWFIWVVASQSVAVAAASVEPMVTTGRNALALVSVLSWGVGVFLYAAAGFLVTLRLMLYPFGPADLTPPYWVAMGALAITVLAGARIVEMANTPMVLVTRGLVAGLSVVFWGFATWLIPVLVAAGWWRHAARGVPLRYDPTLWSVIFPLGMYAVAGIYLGRADRLPIVSWVGAAWLWVAFAAWLVTALAMVHHIGRNVLWGLPAHSQVAAPAP